MRILMVGSEAVPYAKTGGLADVLGALPYALVRLGHEVDVVMPRYRGIVTGRLGHVVVSMDGVTRRTDLYATRTDSLRMIFVDRPEYYDREYLYGPPTGDYPDNAERFAFLAHAALAFAAHEKPYAVVHGHDWQAGLVPVLLTRDYAMHPKLGGLPSVFTIHNLAYQGLFDASSLGPIGLGADLMHIDGLEYWGRISFLKGGVRFSRLLTTVSPRYAEEIQTPEFGFGFDGLLRQRSPDLVGILNGIDYDQWDPLRDVHLPEPFSASNLVGKRSAKRQLLEALALPVTPQVAERPLVGMVSRLVDQKGLDLVEALAPQLPELGATFAVLGSGEPRYEEMWRGLAARHPDRIGVRIGFDEGLAHLVEGGSDIFLMPSRFEPCGLNQMYSLRYGTVPVVRAVGGLYDTVQDYDEQAGTGTGFAFVDTTPAALLEALQRSLTVFQDKKAWTRIQQAGMRKDHSWAASARQYVGVYERAARREH